MRKYSLDRLQYISQGATGEEHINNIRMALEGGCNWVQLRMKNFEYSENIAVAAKVKKLSETYKATFIVNDFVKVAQESDSDGVHLGLMDSAVAEARALLGENKIIGGSANTLSDCLQRVKEGCNYIGLGPYRYTDTKQKLSPILGNEGFRKIMSTLRQLKIAVPVYGIGGICKDDVAELMEAGIYGVAVSGEITRANEKEEMIKMLYHKLNKNYADHLP